LIAAGSFLAVPVGSSEAVRTNRLRESPWKFWTVHKHSTRYVNYNILIFQIKHHFMIDFSIHLYHLITNPSSFQNDIPAYMPRPRKQAGSDETLLDIVQQVEFRNIEEGKSLEYLLESVSTGCHNH